MINKRHINIGIADTVVTNTENFGIVTWSGNSTNNRDLTTGFQPDFVWIKARTADPVEGVAYHVLFDSVRTGYALRSYVAWCWKAGGAASLNQNGDIDSQVSANTAAGFSIVKYTSTTTSSDTVGHG